MNCLGYSVNGFKYTYIYTLYVLFSIYDQIIITGVCYPYTVPIIYTTSQSHPIVLDWLTPSTSVAAFFQTRFLPNQIQCFNFIDYDPNENRTGVNIQW